MMWLLQLPSLFFSFNRKTSKYIKKEKHNCSQKFYDAWYQGGQITCCVPTLFYSEVLNFESWAFCIVVEIKINLYTSGRTISIGRSFDSTTFLPISLVTSLSTTYRYSQTKWKFELPEHMPRKRVKNLHAPNDFPKGETYFWTLPNYMHTVDINISNL